MKLRVVGAIAGMFLGSAWATAQGPTSPAAGTPAPAGPAATRAPVLPASYAAPAAYSAPATSSAPVPAFEPASAVDGSGAWISADYLLWRLNGHLPGVVSGALPQSGGDQLADYHSGLRVSLGYQGDGSSGGFELSGFVLENAHKNFNAGDSIDPTANLDRIPLSVQQRLPIDPPGDIDPADRLLSALHGRTSRQLWGAEANCHTGRCCFGPLSFDFLAGARYLNLTENVTVAGDFTYAEPLTDPDEVPGNPENGRTRTMHTFDSVTTRNRYFGGQVGTTVGYTQGAFSLDGTFKLGAGATYQQVRAFGFTTLDPAVIEPSAGAPTFNRPLTVLPGGLFTPGAFSQNRTRLSFLPELSARASYNLTANVSAHVGYSFLYVSNVVRPSDVTNSVLDTRSSHLTAHGLDLGLQFRY